MNINGKVTDVCDEYIKMDPPQLQTCDRHVRSDNLCPYVCILHSMTMLFKH